MRHNAMAKSVFENHPDIFITYNVKTRLFAVERARNQEYIGQLSPRILEDKYYTDLILFLGTLSVGGSADILQTMHQVEKYMKIQSGLMLGQPTNFTPICVMSKYIYSMFSPDVIEKKEYVRTHMSTPQTTLTWHTHSLSTTNYILPLFSTQEKPSAHQTLDIIKHSNGILDYMKVMSGVSNKKRILPLCV
jgi:hypothetical protein